MKKIFLLCLVLVSCSAPIPTEENPSDTVESQQEKELTDYNVLFTLNTQEFIFLDESIETVNRVIDIHEKYDVPVDIYLNDVILQSYLEEAPDLIERLKDSPVVSVSYHTRPPDPFYYSYDWMGLDQFNTEELKALIENYGSHALDPETGELLDQPGGFSYFEQVFGYAPVAAATPTNSTVGGLLQDYFKDQGALFLVDNGHDYHWGEKKSGMAVRPEDKEVKLFEETDQTAEAIFDDFLEQNSKSPAFMNIKMHDNDFITDESAWVAIYLKNKKQHKQTLTPPFDLSDADDRPIFTEEEAEPFWSLYEACVAYASEHSDQFTPWNMKELAEEL